MKKFLITFALSFIGFYIIEHIISVMFGVDLNTLNYGWLGYAGIVLFYGFKFHIICCLVPLIFTAYKCRHKKCKHEYCDSQKNI